LHTGEVIPMHQDGNGDGFLFCLAHGMTREVMKRSY
jgi:hypothetical protein